MTDKNEKSENSQYSDYDYCPICGELASNEEKHICPEEILEEICREEVAKSEEFDDDYEKGYGDRLEDADFMFNYYDNDYDDNDEDY